MKRPTLILLTLCLLLTALLSACSSPTPTGTPATAAPSAAAPAESAPQPTADDQQPQAPAQAPAASGERVLINMVDGLLGDDGPYMDQIIQGFNDSQTDYEIKRTNGDNQYIEFESGDHDLFLMDAEMIATYYQDGMVRELSDVYTMAGLSPDDFHEITKSYAAQAGGMYAVPLSIHAYTQYYNKALVDKAPETYQDYLTLRDTLDSENSGVYPLGVALYGEHQWLYLTYFLQNGVNIFGETQVQVDKPEVAEVLMKLNALVDRDGISPQDLGANAHMYAFMDDMITEPDVRTATVLTGPWNYPTMKEKYGDDLGVATLPRFGEQLLIPAGGYSFVVHADVTDQAKLEGIAAFLKHVYQPQSMALWADCGHAPVYLQAMEDIQQNPEKWPVANIAYQNIDNLRLLPQLYKILRQLVYVDTTLYQQAVTGWKMKLSKFEANMEMADRYAAEVIKPQ